MSMDSKVHTLRNGELNRCEGVLPSIIGGHGKRGSPLATLATLIETQLLPDSSKEILWLLLIGDSNNRVDLNIIVAETSQLPCYLHNSCTYWMTFPLPPFARTAKKLENTSIDFPF